jgi:riboflavin biosynthesis pyrimidine reductase
MRALIGDGSYDWPEGPWVRVNFVMTVDGSATGTDGRSGTINNEVDVQLFHDLRDTCDVILVGAGTVRVEEYGPDTQKPMLVVGTGLPARLVGAPHVRLSPGGDAQALRVMMAGLFAEGLTHVLCEGGPTLLGSLLESGLVDELCLTITPRLLVGGGRRITNGLVPEDVPLELVSLIEHEGTLLTRWVVSRA